ncbi:DUF5655 domain-containing protein [Clostridium beijerinckii]|uniref:DUF5655 domain-containing protein n=1 Tax=Clostridium beijerinckii TaxID=1520 RepID=UPI0030DB3BF6
MIVYTEEDHFKNSSEEIIDLYNRIKEYITSLNDNITIKAKKLEIGFVYNNKIMIDIHLQKRALKIWLSTKWGTIDDSKHLAKDMSKTGHWGNGDYVIQISDDEELEYIFSLIKQVYKIKSNNITY